MKWINFGGGHHITREGYDIPRLERCIRRMSEGYGLTVYLEPGEAVALNAGYLHTRVLEIQEKEWGRIAILDTSAACHMPDVLEMPYRPPLMGAVAMDGCGPEEGSVGSGAEEDSAAAVVDGRTGENGFCYRLGGPTCLAGDVIGDYRFDHELCEGEILTFGDMAIYSMVKNNTFNGMPLPSIWIKDGDELRLWKEFGYADFKARV